MRERDGGGGKLGKEEEMSKEGVKENERGSEERKGRKIEEENKREKHGK